MANDDFGDFGEIVVFSDLYDAPYLDENYRDATECAKNRRRFAEKDKHPLPEFEPTPEPELELVVVEEPRRRPYTPPPPAELPDWMKDPSKLPKSPPGRSN